MTFTWTPDTETRALALLADGASYRETARTIGCHHTTIRAHLPGRGWDWATRADMSAHRMKMRHQERRTR